MGDAYATSVAALTIVITGLSQQIAAVETKLVDRFEQHPDAAILRSQPGLSSILGARVLAEFGDAPNRYADAKARRNYAGIAPITRASHQPRCRGPGRPQPAPVLRLLPVGPLRPDRLTGCPRLLHIASDRSDLLGRPLGRV